MNYIKWDVKEVKVEGRTFEHAGEITAILKGSAPWGLDSNVVGIHKDLQNHLNLAVDSLYPHMPSPQMMEQIISRADKELINRVYGKIKTLHHEPDIKKVVFNSPATIVFWKDGSKTVVKAQNDEMFDPEKGLAMAIAKKTMGNKGNYYNSIKKWVDEYYESKTFGDALIEAAKKEPSDHSKYASLRAAFYSLGQVANNKRAKKSDMSETIEEALKYIKEFLDKEDR